jgi:hypothetical protein
MTQQRQPVRALAVQLRVQQEERQTPEVITMQVTHNDSCNGRRIDSDRFQTDETRRAAIEQAPPGSVLDQDARLETATRTEGVAATNEPNPHPRPHPHSLPDTESGVDRKSR